MKIYVLGIIIIILDGILTYLMPSYFNELTYFYPMFSIVYLVFLYGYSKKYLQISVILGFIYDLLYINIFLYNTLIFLLLGKINKKIFNYLQNNLFNKVLVLILNIIIYDVINYFIISLSRYNQVIINDFLYKVSHSLLINVFFMIVLNIIFKKILKMETVK